MLIAQLTDLHIRMPGQKAYRIVETDRCLPPAIAALNQLEPRPDCLILSGDLTDFGRPAEYAHLRDMLQPLDMPCYLIPGNHDDRAALLAAFPDQPWQERLDGFVQYAIEHHPLRLLMLDTVVPGSPHGALCPRRLDWLAERLAEQPGRPTLIAMHHPPFDSGIDHMDAIGLLQGRAELEAIVAAFPNIERIICGHQHRTVFRRFGGTLASICPSPAHQVALDLRPDGPSAFILEPAGFHLHLWHGGALVSHVAVLGEHAGPYPFHEENGQLIDD